MVILWSISIGMLTARCVHCSGAVGPDSNLILDEALPTLIWWHRYITPTELTSSFECFDQARLQTCEPVSTHCSGWPVNVFQNRMHWSAVPPPLARRPCWWGDQAMALTAARWSVYVWTGVELVTFHTNNLLSLPPLARCWWSGDHLRPHT